MKRRIEIPDFFKNSYDHVEEVVKNLKKAKVELGCKTPGGRNVYVVEYGTPNEYVRKANYSSALGAHDVSCYKQNKKPCVFLMGGIHGGEFEGTAALLNLFNILENGTDLKGREHKELVRMIENTHLIIIPCLNPDGRCRIPFEGFGGVSHDMLRYYNQGTWADGSLCGWPGCKQVHPMKDCDHLGAYFNDDGINLMHDDFFNPMAEETKLVFRLATKYAPDLIAGLHGAAEMGYGIYHPGCATYEDLEEGLAFEKALKETFEDKGIRYIETHCDNSVREFNQTVALYYACGALSVTWESYQGVLAREDEPMDVTVYDKILDAHFLFFDECFKHVINKFAGE